MQMAFRFMRYSRDFGSDFIISKKIAIRTLIVVVVFDKLISAVVLNMDVFFLERVIHQERQAGVSAGREPLSQLKLFPHRDIKQLY